MDLVYQGVFRTPENINRIIEWGEGCGGSG